MLRLPTCSLSLSDLDCFRHIVVPMSSIDVSEEILGINVSQAYSAIFTTIWRPDFY